MLRPRPTLPLALALLFLLAPTLAALPGDGGCGGCLEWRHPPAGLRALGEVGVPSAVAASPAGALLYAAGIVRLPGDDEPGGRVYVAAFSAVGGLELWRHVATEATRSAWVQDLVVSPDGLRVYVGARASGGLLGRTLALDAATGAPLWSSPLPAYSLGVSHDGARLYVGGGSGSVARLHALDALAGIERWSATVGYFDGFGYSQSIHESADGARVHFGGSHGVSTLDAATGAALWSTPYRLGAFSSLALGEGGRLYAVVNDVFHPRETGLVALDGATGEARWRVAGRFGGLAVAPGGDAVYASGYFPWDETAVAFDAADGARRWTMRAPSEDGVVRNLVPSPDGARVYLATSMDTPEGGSRLYVAALDAATGGTAWSSRHGPATEHRWPGPEDTLVTPDGARVVTTTIKVTEHPHTWELVAYGT